MASQGPLAPGTAADSTDGGTGTWINPNNIKVNDSSYATCELSGPSNQSNTTHYLQATNFGFTIPGGATINGILVEWIRNASQLSGTSNPRDKNSYIIKGGTQQTTQDKASASVWGSSDATASYGNSSDLWGLSWASSDINSSGFGASLRAQRDAAKSDVIFNVNFCRITVTYTAAAGGSNPPLPLVVSRVAMMGSNA